MDQLNNQDLNSQSALMLLHSIKGSYSLYGFQELTQKIHDLEDGLAQEDIPAQDIQLIIQKANAAIKDSTQRVLSFIFELSPESTNEELEKVMNFLEENHYQEIISKINKRLEYTRLDKFIHQYQFLTLDLATKLGKQVSEISYTGGETLFETNQFSTFFNSCIHIFRNIIDHGIESTADRISLKKDPKASIQVVCSTTPEFIILNISDDGRGIDPKKIKSKMHELNYEKDDINKPDHEILQHIFDKQFSTAEVITNLSGRGVGLSDIKNQVMLLSGTVEVKTILGEGTSFIFHFPINPPPPFEQITETTI